MRPLLVKEVASWIGMPAAAVLAPGYFTMTALAAIVSSWLIVRHARRAGVDHRLVLTALAAGYAGAIGGGILLPLLADLLEQALRGHLPIVRWAGMDSYCGGVGGITAAVLVLRHKMPARRFLDLLGPPMGLGIAIVRIGCFIAGCDFGKVTSLPWGVRFPAGSPAWTQHVRAGLVPADRAWSLPVHPTELYESLLALAVFAAGVLYARRPRRTGSTFALCLSMYAAGRIGIEVLRGDSSRGLVGPVSTAQLASVVVLALFAFGWLRARRRVAAAAVLVLVGLAIPARAQNQPHNGFDLSLSGGIGSAINRPSNQVPQLVGIEGLFLYSPDGMLGFGVDIEALSNEVAVHQSFLGTVALSAPVAQNLEIGARVGLGVTYVNFLSNVFEDAAGLDFRVGGTLRLALGDYMMLDLQPFGLDWLSVSSFGGPILEYQIRLGLSFTTRHSRPRPQYPQPYYYPQPQPYLQPQPYPQPYPQPPQQPYPQRQPQPPVVVPPPPIQPQ